ncbi:MAG TPA: DUF3558 family protein [Candidatus Limnocylindrales bacterium]|nr:DUF3558 family protein [Candidatus Limnocylindrales bacterium]
MNITPLARTSFHAAALSLVTALALAACGGGGGAPGTGATANPGGPLATAAAGPATQVPAPGTTQAPAGATVDACALLSDADIKAASGLEPKGPGTPALFGYYTAGCQWDIVNEGAAVAPTLAIGVLPTGGMEQYDRDIAPFGVEYGYEPIEGLGDKAVDYGGGAVLVLTGDTLVEVQYAAIKANDVEIATELARTVLSHLGG